jgi:hypothetical protein
MNLRRATVLRAVLAVFLCLAFAVSPARVAGAPTAPCPCCVHDAHPCCVAEPGPAEDASPVALEQGSQQLRDALAIVPAPVTFLPVAADLIFPTPLRMEHQRHSAPALHARLCLWTV